MNRKVLLQLFCFQIFAVFTNASRIIGGEAADRGKYTYMVSLYTDLSTPICGGVLVAPNVVLSAAHCMQEVGIKRVKIGCTDLSAIDETGCEELKVADSFIHPKFSFKSNSSLSTPRYDFMLLLLEASSTNKPIRFLPSPELILGGDLQLLILGWGAFVAGGGGTTLLQEAYVNVIPNLICNYNYEPVYRETAIEDNMFCASSEDIDACTGDSGGPALIKCASMDEDVLVGVVSWGLSCASPQYPGVYGRVSSGFDFISKTLLFLNVSFKIIDNASASCPSDPPKNTTDLEPLYPPTPYPVFPGEWFCQTRYYATRDGCDCNCGAHDPDCDLELPQQRVYNCADDEICVQGSCMNPGEYDNESYITPYPTHSEPPSDWECPEEFFSAYDGCDCNCGAHDPDCDTNPPQNVFNCDTGQICEMGRCIHLPLVSQKVPSSAPTSPLLTPTPTMDPPSPGIKDPGGNELAFSTVQIGMTIIAIVVGIGLTYGLVILGRQRQERRVRLQELAENNMKSVRRRSDNEYYAGISYSNKDYEFEGERPESEITFQHKPSSRYARFSSFTAPLWKWGHSDNGSSSPGVEF